VQRDRVDPDRRPERGHPARERLDHRQPEALVLRRHEHRVGGVDPVRHLGGVGVPEREQRHVARRLPRAVEPLERARRIVREEQVRARGIEAEPLACLRPRDRAEALERDPDRQDRDAPLRARAREVGAERARDRGRQRRERKRRACHEPGATYEQVVAMQRHDDRPAPRGERRQRREAEVRVDDVVRRAAQRPVRRARARAAADRRDRPQQRARAGREREDLDLDARPAPQRLDLVAHEDAALRRGGGRPHVRHDERAHRAERTFVAHLSHFRHERA
jgi:hypothetical protein